MSLSFKKLAARLFRRSTSASARPAPLVLEVLESREVPTVVTVEAIDGREGVADVLFRVTRSDTSGGDSVPYSISGTATEDVDYLLTPKTATFDPGETVTYVVAEAFDDGVSEPTETVTLTLVIGSIPDYTIGSPGAATAHLFDNDTPMVTVAKVADATEGGDNGAFRFTRIGNLSSSLVANYTVGGTATSGTDFTALSGTVTFAANAATADVTVAALADNAVDDGETVTATVTSDSGYSVGTPYLATVTIADDPPVIAVTGSDTFEGSATGGFSFTRSGGNLSSSLTVTYSVSGTATSVTDYTALSGSVTFAAGVDRVEVPVEALGDNTADDGETVIATLTGAGSTYTLDDEADVATVTIADQSLTVSVVRLNDGEEGVSNGTFRFTRSGDISASLTVTYTVTGTATSGTDYTALSGSVTFAASSDHTDVTVTVTNDGSVEPTETVTVTLDPDDDYELGNDADTVFIRDNDTNRVYWVSTGSTDWDVGSNWSTMAMPTTTDDVYFSGPSSNVSVSALGSGTAGLTFAGVHFVDGYSDTVTLAVPLTVGTFEQTTGTLDQDVMVVDETEITDDLTVTAAFLWTGGTLNTLDNGAQVIIDGAAGVIDPPDVSSIATASTLNVVGGSVVTLWSGILEFTGGSGMSIASEVKGVVSDNNVNVVIKNSASVAPTLEIKTNGSLQLLTNNKLKGGKVVSDVAILNKGHMAINSGIRFEVSGTVGVNGPSIKQEDGIFYWTSGADIVTTSGMTITGGDLLILVSSPNTEVILVGNLVFDSPDGSLEFKYKTEGKLRVQCDVTWTSGTYRPKVDGSTALASSQWDATGTFTVGNAAVVDADVQFADPAQGSKWRIIGGAKGVNATAPALSDNVTADFEMVAEGGTPQARRYWSLRRK